MARKAAKAAPNRVEPEDESQEELESEGTDSTSSHGKAISKAEAIRRMLADGIENPSVASAEIKSRFGIDVTPQHFSATKSQIKSKAGIRQPKGKPGRKPTAAAPSQAVEGYLAPPPKSAPTGGSELLDAMEAMKPLVASLGKEQVKRIVDLLG